MAFENTRLTEKEIMEFEKRELKDPWLLTVNMRISICTIDREREVFLVRHSQDQEEWENYYFVLYWKGAMIPIKLREHWDDSKSPRVWELISIKTPDFFMGKEKEILECLKEALITYSFNGSPNESLNKTIAVEFNFDLSKLIGGELK